jgi:CheY-like chemotaxis protein
MRAQNRILLVEDDTSFTHLLSTALVRTGYEVMCVPDGQTALECLAVFNPDTIFLDMYLPILNGWEFLQQYHSLPIPHVPIVASSASNVDPTSLTGIAAYLAKPFSIVRFLHLLEQVLASVDGASVVS